MISSVCIVMHSNISYYSTCQFIVGKIKLYLQFCYCFEISILHLVLYIKYKSINCFLNYLVSFWRKKLPGRNMCQWNVLQFIKEITCLWCLCKVTEMQIKCYWNFLIDLLVIMYCFWLVLYSTIYIWYSV